MTVDPYATAEELGIMVGFPPPHDKQVNRSNAIFLPPYNRWAYLHMRTLYPSAPIRNADTVRPVDVEIDSAIAQLSVPRADGSVADFPAFLRETYTDSLVVATADRIVYEHYSNGMHATHPHQMMSCTKSFAGLFALIAGAEGLLDEAGTVTDILPELAGASAFADASVGQVMDMVNSMDFSEDYADPNSGIWDYGRALGWVDPAPGAAAHSLYEFLATLRKDPAREHGEVFHYQTPKTDVVNWMTNRVTGKSFQDKMSDDLWARLGTEGETYVLLDPCGTLVAGGGLNAAPRDLARFAMMLLNNGTVDGTRILPTAVIDDLEAGASREAFANGPDAAPPMDDGDWSYRAQWWIRHTPGREAISAIGVNGQWIYVDRGHRVAIVKQSSQPVSADASMDQFTLNGFDAVIDHLG